MDAADKDWVEEMAQLREDRQKLSTAQADRQALLAAAEDVLGQRFQNPTIPVDLRKLSDAVAAAQPEDRP